VNNEVARGDWGWDGFIISDCGAIDGISGSHKYTNTPSTTIAAGLNQGGVDVNCGGSPAYYNKFMCNAVKDGTILQSDVDRAARR
jgi:beta-glucosidase-like glycosyl hydrolase